MARPPSDPASEAVRNVTVLVIDDHPVARRGLSVILRESLAVETILEAENSAVALTLAREEDPDLVLVDMHMPGSTPARELCAHLRAILPSIPIAVVTAFDRLDDIQDCLAAGASGCLLKDTSEVDIGASLRALMRGETVIDPRIAQRLERHVGAHTATHARHLTSRERDVLALLASGCSNRKIAEQLFLSEATVKGYVTNLLEKLGASSRLEAVVRAAEAGLIAPHGA